MDEEERKPSNTDMTMSFVQAFLGIAILFGIGVPVLILVYVILPMGWNGIWPLSIMIAFFLCFAWIGWIVYQKKRDSLPVRREDD
ncbi:DUF4131 domain-containing protein [bacterium]|nr:DUF4131 domain-containing protein [bacterium]